MQHELIPFRALERDHIFAFISGLILNVDKLDEYAEDSASRYCDCVAEMAVAAESYGLAGNVWKSWLATLLVECETQFAVLQERGRQLDGTIKRLALEDIETIHAYMNFDMTRLDGALGVKAFSRAGEYKPSATTNMDFDRTAGTIIRDFAEDIKRAHYAADMYNILTKFYAKHGVGRFALHKAFRWDALKGDIVPITHTDDISFKGLIGYERQKKSLIANTVAFLEGRPANNVLLYGESGTGKSSSIKALLNEYAPLGLRMVEVYKHQIGDIERIIEVLKRRNYRFILFMDDLSFERFETEYKFLKVLIEGGLERRPENILIYATSNRRHLMKETWADREDKYEDMHESETIQERMSLVDRFGLMISYFSPEKDEYMNIVRELAKEYGLSVPEEELELGAVRWELKHGGFSGRCARQFIEFLAGTGV